ncbi:MAG: hypothetical protein RM022_005185 [Nostoc sp. EfeVER01]|uniref:hypothetical protein n=1 Tax=unclassified Nostoc TaxID=2593658 RepID=UPI002AD5083E|nr:MULTISPECIES: hypothetical protein [unclassified Nostoc]MDZ7947884.1 hypothetical protein [Nostoc sp. EfeVER01]MDZ7994319.1 hypothetical protein [Nostoc sp. EspVER01]
MSTMTHIASMQYFIQATLLISSIGFYIEALAIAQQRLGANHPNTITIRKNLEGLQRNRHP